MSTDKIPKNPRSEAALKWCIKHWDKCFTLANSDGAAEIKVFSNMSEDGNEAVAIIDLKELVKRRAPLKGIQKEVMKAVRTHTPKKKKKAATPKVKKAPTAPKKKLTKRKK